MTDRDGPRSRPLDELEREEEPELPGVAMAAHTLEIEATRPAEDVDVAGVPDPALRHRRPWVRFLIGTGRSEEHTSELQSLMRISYAVFCLKKKNKNR